MDRDKIANPDPESILRELPEQERETFLAEYRRALDEARDPAGWPELRRFLREWALHAVAVNQPGYYERLEKIRAGDHSGSMLFEDAVAMIRAERLQASAAEGEQHMASGEPMVTLDDVVPGKRLSVNVALDVAQAIKELAARHDVTITEVVRRAVSVYKYIDDERALGRKVLIERHGTVWEVTFE